jgi:UDP-N-acetylmuramyl pentapeptide phosphotransferase/UDP-N-acetylglucosamine-1-phosphate transferase
VPLSILIGAILGFAAFNFPFGRIFLGDGGAYTIGFLLAWLAIFLLSLAPAFSPWAVLLIFFWPIADTLLAIWRRVAGRVSVGQPDRLHVHQVIMRAVEILFLKRRHRAVSNPLTTLIIQPFMLTPVVFGVVFWDSSRHAALALLVFSVFFVFSYFKLIKFIRSSRG